MSDEATNDPQPSSGKARQFVLFGLLALLLAALAYDRIVARPSVVTAYNQIVDRNTEVNATGGEIFTNMDVRQMLGKVPSSTFQDDNGDTVEVFSWRSGMPLRTYDLFTVYKPAGNALMFHRQAQFEYETSGEVSNISVSKMIEMPEGYEDPPDGGGPGEDVVAGPSGGGPGGGGGGGGFGGNRPVGSGSPGGGGWDPAARFAQLDEDGDGVWKGEEIPERARENMDEMDTDGDGAISKDEWMARIQAMGAQFGGGGGQRGGGEGRPRERRRPELEDEADDKPASEAADKKPEGEEAEKPASEEAAEKPEGEAEKAPAAESDKPDADE